MANPDNRADNVENIQRNIQNTQKKISDTEQYLAEFGSEISSEEQNQLEAKNERRRQSVEGFREEVKDEANQQA